MSGPHIPVRLMFKAMNQLLMLDGPWRKGLGQKRCCSSQVCMQTPTDMGWDGGPGMPGFPVASGAVRGEAEPGRSIQNMWLSIARQRML